VRWGLTIGAIAVLLLGGCSSDPSPPTPSPAAVAEGQGFVLALAVPADHFDVGQAIDVRTTLAWTGLAPTVTIWGSGMGPVFFQFEELTGRRKVIGGAITADCAMHQFAQGVTPIPLRKNGAWEGDDPDVGFYVDFFHEKELRLPAGRWRIVAELGGYLAECAMDAPAVSLRAAVEFEVG
jgi:hypothetical protein